ncbi:MAG: (4Fe-4S)-binding protein, partial [Lapillicoccus sp.]
MGATFVGMPAFPQAAHTALADTQLRANLRHATHTIRDKRAKVVDEVEDWEALRRKGAHIKDDMLAHLDDHLVALEESLTARGATV